MKTKQIPPVLALIAGLVTCIVSFLNGVDMVQFAKALCLTFLIFFILGSILMIILDRNFPPQKEEEAEGEDSEEEHPDGEPQEAEENFQEAAEDFDEEDDR